MLLRQEKQTTFSKRRQLKTFKFAGVEGAYYRPLKAATSIEKMPPAARLTLVQRQQQLLEECGFSKPKPNQQPKLSFASDGPPLTIKAERPGNRPPPLLQRRRKCRRYRFGMEADDGTDGAASSATRFSCAPSLHPSMANATVRWHAPVTIGAGDDTAYWDFQHRCAEKSDMA